VGTQATTTYSETAGSNDKGAWVSGQNYNQGDVVTDPFDNEQYGPRADIDCSEPGVDCTLAPHDDVYDLDLNPGGKWVKGKKTPLDTGESNGNAADEADLWLPAMARDSRAR
jgi:hypothetical protein